MGRNKVSLKHQCYTKLDSLAAFGEKKNDKDNKTDKNYNCNRSQKIHSYSTMKTYKDAASGICDWFKDHHPEVKRLEQIETSHVKEYVEDLHSKGYSNYTLSKNVSTLNKLCNSDSREFWRLSDFGNYQRKTSEIVNNRNIKTDYRTDHYERNQSAILMASAFGIRRSSTESATMSQMIYKGNEIVGIQVQEKGGKVRCAPLLESYKEQVNQYCQERIQRLGENCSICDPADRNTNLHYYRACYAVSLYQELNEARVDGRDYYNGMRSTFIDESALDKACQHPRYCNEYTSGYHTEILGMVSQSLGHNRISVVLGHYLHSDE